MTSTASSPAPSRLGDYSTRSGRFVALWVFGVATTLLLLGLWGRAVTTDRDGIESSLRAAVATDEVAEQVRGWVAGALEEWTRVSGDEAVSVAGAVLETPSAAAAVEQVLAEVVEVAVAPPGTTGVVDVAAAIDPFVPGIAAELQAAGVDADPTLVRAVLAGMEPITVESDPAISITRVVSSAHGMLTRVVVVALLTLLVSGGAATALAEERWVMVRSLASRILVSALSFAVFLRLGAWALDPQRGRSPFAAGGSVLLRSNGTVILLVGLVAGIAAGGATLAVRSRRRAMGPQSNPS